MKGVVTKTTLLLIVIAAIGVLTFAQKQQQRFEKPLSDRWLVGPRPTFTSTEGVVRTEHQALELGRIYLKYLVNDEGPFEVKRIGMYWIVYSRLTEKLQPNLKIDRTYVKISAEDGGVRAFGYFDPSNSKE